MFADFPMRHILALLLIAASASAQPVPESIAFSEGKPFVQPEQAERSLLHTAVRSYMGRAPGTFGAHPSAAFFPGAVTSPERVTRKVSYNPNRIHRWDTKAGNAPNLATGPESWQDTGLYASPGEIVHVTAASLPAGRVVRIIIGCHKDNLLRLDKWLRFPVITRSFELRAGENAVANAFGGTIFIQVTGDPAESSSNSAELTFANAVAAPMFTLGKDNAESWAKSLANPAPWAVIAGKHVVLHVQSSVAAQVKDPVALMTWWDRVLVAQADLVALDRLAPERIVPDIQISAGWMHSGYPFMCHLKPSQGHMVDLTRLSTKGDWGFFHELGHNHQRRDWTFPGQVEVTVNFFSLLCMEKVVGLPAGQGHGSIKNLDALLQKRLATPPDMGPFEQLAPFMALIQAHTWEPLRLTLRSYKDTPSAAAGAKDLPSQQNLFVVRYGQFAKSDVSGFFEQLGYPVTAETKAALAAFPRFDLKAVKR
jgi:hypothetical protein